MNQFKSINYLANSLRCHHGLIFQIGVSGETRTRIYGSTDRHFKPLSYRHRGSQETRTLTSAQHRPSRFQDGVPLLWGLPIVASTRFERISRESKSPILPLNYEAINAVP